MKRNKEYILSKQISDYLSYQYPKLIFHFDMAGVNLSKAQSGMIKYLQKHRGYPDLFIVQPTKKSAGLFIELKEEGQKLYKKDGRTPVSEHVGEQMKMLTLLRDRGYQATFAIGFDEAKRIIDNYLNE